MSHNPNVFEALKILGIKHCCYNCIHRCASFVKHQLDADKTEIYTDKLGKEILNDVYLNYCKINYEWGENPCLKAKKQCESNLLIKMRWNFNYNGR